ncbi:membrane-spanning 4-domains subfamily A member 10 [Tachyglossus aculeatus]|uniref:membrane-spanning 4-domains subfamily A member 10 n=1 Tax=Tachyglossus aculeatus TaxID=9261 RepID=UPI0018F49A42|nr:membrane-spanning 4-domains subfamily A member 10 [Tachyglossus aculeatus]
MTNEDNRTDPDNPAPTVDDACRDQVEYTPPSQPVWTAPFGSEQVTALGIQPGDNVPSGNPKRRFSKQMGMSIFHILSAIIHFSVGIWLLAISQNFHLVALKSWYPIWGGLSYFLSGGFSVMVEKIPNLVLKLFCLVMNIFSIFCALSGVFVLIKDLFLENTFPLWTLYPFYILHVQQLEIILMIFSALEIMPAISMVIFSCTIKNHSSDDLETSFVNAGETPAEDTTRRVDPPPSYEEVFGQEGRDINDGACTPDSPPLPETRVHEGGQAIVAGMSPLSDLLNSHTEFKTK